MRAGDEEREEIQQRATEELGRRFQEYDINCIAVLPDSPFKSAKELIEAARAKPKTLSLGLGAVGGAIVGGPFEWLNTVEYLFPITADDTLRGVVFTDFGTVESNVSIHQMRVAPGFGLRITLPAMGPAPIALDFAVPVVYAPYDSQQLFSFFVGFAR